MKKLTAIFICLMLIISVSGCFGGNDDKKNTDDNNFSPQQNDAFDGGGSGGEYDKGGMNGIVEDLTDAETESLRSRIDAIDGLTFSDIRFEGDKAYVRVKSTLENIGKDVKASIRDMVISLRGGIKDVEVMY